MRSAPTSFGLSYRIEIPVRVPGSTTIGANANAFRATSRSACVCAGTTLATIVRVPIASINAENPSSSSPAYRYESARSQTERTST